MNDTRTLTVAPPVDVETLSTRALHSLPDGASQADRIEAKLDALLGLADKLEAFDPAQMLAGLPAPLRSMFGG